MAGLPGPSGASSHGPQAKPTSPTIAPGVFAALEKQLGPKLEKSRTQVEIVVIDHMDRQPSEN